MIRIEGEYQVDWSKFSSVHSGIDNLDRLCTSPIAVDDQIRLVNDVCPIGSGGREDYYLRIVPYGPHSTDLNSIIEDCDLLTYLGGPLSVPRLTSPRGPALLPAGVRPEHLLTMMKQRGFHSEAGYRAEDGSACQVALWGNQPSDRLFHQGNTQQNTIHIFRLSFPWLEDSRQMDLKREIHKWKRIFNRHTFPHGKSMNLDPVDFTSVEDLSDIARKLIARAPDSPTGLDPVNCVQWTYQAVALSLNYPLTREVLQGLDVKDEFERHWEPLVGYSDDSVRGVGRLPTRQYSPARALQLALDTYFPTTDLLHLLETAQSGDPGFLDVLTSGLALPIPGERLMSGQRQL
jgi:hypothetical protein